MKQDNCIIIVGAGVAGLAAAANFEDAPADSVPCLEYDHGKSRLTQTDPFSRGAYSYAKVGADGAEAGLATPVKNTLFLPVRAPTPPDITGRYMAQSGVAIARLTKLSNCGLTASNDGISCK